MLFLNKKGQSYDAPFYVICPDYLYLPLPVPFTMLITIPVHLVLAASLILSGHILPGLYKQELYRKSRRLVK